MMPIFVKDFLHYKWETLIQTQNKKNRVVQLRYLFDYYIVRAI